MRYRKRRFHDSYCFFKFFYKHSQSVWWTRIFCCGRERFLHCIRWELSKSVANLIELTQIKSKRKTAKKICCERATKKQTENDKKIEESEKNTHTNRHRIEELAESRNARCLFEIYLNLFMWSLGKRRHGRNDAKVHTQANDKKQKLNETNTNEVNKRAHRAQTQPSQFGGGTKKHPFLKHRQTRITAAIAGEKLPNTNIRIWCFCGFSVHVNVVAGAKTFRCSVKWIASKSNLIYKNFMLISLAHFKHSEILPGVFGRRLYAKVWLASLKSRDSYNDVRKQNKLITTAKFEISSKQNVLAWEKNVLTPAPFFHTCFGARLTQISNINSEGNDESRTFFF